MLELLNYLPEFSRINCVAICAFLIPAILICTITTLVLVFLQSDLIRLTTILSSFLAIIMLFHVATWFMIGVVTPVTFILTSLAFTCLAINFWARNIPPLWQTIVVKVGR